MSTAPGVGDPSLQVSTQPRSNSNRSNTERVPLGIQTMPESSVEPPPGEEAKVPFSCPVQGCNMSWPVTAEMGAAICSRKLDIHIQYIHPPPPQTPPPPASGLPQDALTTFLEKQTAVLVELTAQAAEPCVQSARL